MRCRSMRAGQNEGLVSTAYSGGLARARFEVEDKLVIVFSPVKPDAPEDWAWQAAWQ